MNEIQIVIFGVGPIGQRITKVVLEKKGLKIVGAIDIAKDKVGRDLGEIIGIGKKLGVIVTDDPDSLFTKIEADVALVATTSHTKTAYPQVVKCINAGMNVISTCEELAYPWLKEPQLASEIDEIAKKHGVTILGTGINPGFFMDTFPLVLTGLCREVKRIEASRTIPTASRRASFQKKIGTGMTPKEFRKKINEGEITGHVGFQESVALTAAALGLKLDEIKELPPELVIAEEEVKTTYTTVRPGQMLGYIDIVKGIANGKEVIIYKLVMHGAVKEGYEEYIIEGTPNIRVRMSEIVGDWETAHIVVNTIPKVINAKPGLLTMKELPPPSAILDDVRMLKP
ncbi:MAG: Gfo/Idh/MocA family oxidoreductase [Candidatus Hodarchaeota archaeon]